MNHFKKAIFVTVTILLLASTGLFAQSVKESSQTVVEFSSLDLENESLKTIMESYEAELASYESEYQSLYSKMYEAYNKRNSEDYYEAKGLLMNLKAPSITAEQTETLVARILQEDDADLKAEFASWLYKYSRYYRPQLSFSKEYSSSDGGSTYMSYRYSVCVEPGTAVQLPTVVGARSQEGVLVGWGVSPDEVLYEVGEEIPMPYTDQTLYAIYKTGIMFKDSVTGVEVFEDGSEINAPELVAPDDSYVFLGWYDSTTGQKADGSTTLDVNESATFEAKWRSLKVSDVSVKYYKDCTVPAGTQVKLTFSLENQGNTGSGSLSVELVPENSDTLKLLSGKLSSSNISASQSKSGSFTVVANGNSGDVVNATIVVTDASGNVWNTPISLTIK